MTEWILTSSLLIVLMLGLRLVLKGRIGLRLQYALWALVLVRLLVPFQFATSSISALTFAEKLTPAPITSLSAPAVTPPSTQTNTPATQPNTPVTHEPAVPGLTVLPEAPQTPEKTGWEYPFTLRQTLTFVWLLGMSLLALSMIISNLRFGLRLRHSRQAAPAYHKHRVFYSPVVDSPCLFGLFRPCIYLPESCREDDEALSHVLAHEQAHYRHADHIWSVLRCVCLCLHWYNPLVWAAAFLSKADSELACDEAAIQALGEEYRTQYGKTLIRLSCAKPGAKTLLSTATTMDGSERTLKNRILLIAKHPKTKWVTLITLILVTAVICLVVFTNPKNEPGTETESPEIDVFDPPVYNDGGIEGVFLFSGSKLYVWDYTAAEPSLAPGYAKPDGVVLNNDIHAIPCLDAYACRLEEGTEIYQDTVYDWIYTKPGPIGSDLEKATFVPVMNMAQWWQETPITAGYYSLIGNAHLRDKYYIYLNGNGGGAYICGNFETPMAVGENTMQISRKYSLKYRMDGIVLTTSTGTYLYYGQEKPEIPASDTLTAGTYRIVGEMGSDYDHINSPYFMQINTDGTGTVNYLDKTYDLILSGDTLYINGAAAYYSYSSTGGRGALAMQIDGEKTLLILYGNSLFSADTEFDTSLTARGKYNGLFNAARDTTDLSRTLSCVHNGKDIDLRRLFHNGMEENPEPSAEELQYLISQGFDPKFGITRITAEQMDITLQSYLGMNMTQCDLVGIEDFVFYNGSYFLNHRSKEQITISVLGVIHGDNCDTVLYRYTGGCMPQYEGLAMEVMVEYDANGGAIVRYNRISDYTIG